MDAKQLAILIIGSIVVIAAAYYTTYYIAAKGNNLQRGRVIRVHDKTALTRDNALYIIEVANKFYLIGSTSHSFTLLDTLDSEAVGEVRQTYAGGVDLSFLQSGFTAAKNSKLFNRVRDIARKNRPEEYSESQTEQSKVSFAKEEDDLDAVYRKIQTRRAGAAAAESVNKPDNLKEKPRSFESFLNDGDK